MEEVSGKSPVSLITEELKEAERPLARTIETFYSLIARHYGNSLRVNEMTGYEERWDEARQRWTRFEDADEYRIKAFIESEYGLYSTQKTREALGWFFSDHRVNPLLETLCRLEWDGVPRITGFLHRVMKAEDTPYTRECSRLIFAGGIHRAFDPGCKFDEMIVLVGAQGSGKSTLVRWLNMDEQYFREIKTISGREGVEAMNGVWIGEMSELMAMDHARTAETVKAFLSCREDNIRPSYARHVRLFPRRCVFIGTTNNPQFLSDRTGNRRFYPVECHVSAGDLFARREEIMADIRRCWAEAVCLYREGRLLPHADERVRREILCAQENALEDDWRCGAVRQYLEQAKQPGDTVSVIELWHRALNYAPDKKPARRDSLAINRIMNSQPGWVRCPHPVSTPWGPQRGFLKNPPPPEQKK